MKIFSDCKDLSADSNHTDFSNSNDPLVSPINIVLVEHNLEVLQDNVKEENDEIKVEYIDEINAASDFDADIEQDGKY